MTRQSIMASNCRHRADPVTVRENNNNGNTAKAFLYITTVLINFSKGFSIVTSFNVYVTLWPLISFNKRKLQVLIYVE
jgi:hypothetical protein